LQPLQHGTTGCNGARRAGRSCGRWI
jgi:hypothetical protein